MKTPLHARNKNVRDLYRAVPVNRDKEEKEKYEAAWKEFEALVDKGYKEFWAKRTQGKPPRVSKYVAFDFDTLDIA